MCQSMFCALPFPSRRWDEAERGRMLLFLPLIGLEIGALHWALSWLLAKFAVPCALRALALCAAPAFLTGFLHLDGFMDVTDAVRSYRDRARKQEILKDSRVGAFAVIGIVFVLLGEFSAFCAPNFANARAELLLIPALSRACSALFVGVLPPMARSQYAQTRAKRSHSVILLLILVLLLGAGFFFFGRGGFALLCVPCAYALALLRAYRSLGGMNGDVSGYCLTLSELAGFLVLSFL